MHLLQKMKGLSKGICLICDGGCNTENISSLIEHLNGVIIGTSLKQKGELENPICIDRVKDFMAKFH